MEIQIISGFLGAGKTTFLNQYLPLLDGKTVVIENEFGDIGIDSELIKADIPVREIYAGCICCSLSVEFREGICEIAKKFHPDRILIEPSGVGRLSDVISACEKARLKDGVDVSVTKLISIVDIAAFEECAECFGSFYLDQIQHGRLLLLSNLEGIEKTEKKAQIDRIREKNSDAIIYEGDWRELDKETLLTLIDMAENYTDNPEAVTRQPIPADKVFSSLSFVNLKVQAPDQIKKVIDMLKDKEYGQVLRVKGILQADTGEVIQVDATPYYSRYQSIETSNENERENKLVLIGCNLEQEKIRKLFYPRMEGERR
ncbi:MAG: GTP-binding protein [Muricomes sp.]